MLIVAGQLSTALAQRFNIFPTNKVWKYMASTDTGFCLNGTGWETTGYDDSGWPEAPGGFTGGETAAAALVGVTTRTLPAPTTSGGRPQYFRTHFNLASTAGISLILSNRIDDQAVFYINGTRVADYRHPTDPESCDPGGDGGDEATVWVVITLTEAQLAGIVKAGDNVIAASVHQNSSTSSDMVFVCVLSGETAFPCMIVQQPTNTVVNEGQPATFQVTATGSNPLSYQWFEENVGPITDATNASFTIPFPLRGDSGRRFYVVVDNPLPGTCESAHVSLTVTPDVTPPYVVCAYGSNDSLTVFVTFNEPVTNALSPTSYSITPVGGGDNLQVVDVVYASATFDAVALTINSSTPMMAGVSYDLFVSAVQDFFNNSLDNSPAIHIARFPTSIALPINDVHLWKYSNPTSNVSLGTAWRAVNYDDSGWSNGLALLGVETATLPEPLRTPFSGYVAGAVRTFYFRTHFNFPDNPTNAVLCLQTVIDDAAAFHLNGVEVFRLRLPAVYNHDTEGTGGAVGDAAYEGPFYVCVTNLVKGDNVMAVEVHQTGGTSSDIVMGVSVSALVPRLEPIVITQDPVSRTVNEGDPVIFTVDFVGTNPHFQWRKNNVDIPDGTNSTYTIAFARAEDAGSYTVFISNEIPSMDTSAAATLTVIEDTTAPTILCAYFSGPSNDIFVVYSEIVTNGIDDPFGYAVTGGGGELFIATQSYTDGTNSGTTVRLELSANTPRIPGASYTLSTTGIRDRFGNAMGDTTVPIAGFPRTLLSLNSEWRYNSATNLGTNWIPKLYNDSAWASGAALFDGKLDPLYPTGYTNRISLDGQTVNTHISISNETSTAALSAVYFRTHFNYSGSPSAVLGFRHFVDDGAVYYLNGKEVLRYFMPAGVITNRTLATRTEGDANFEGPVYTCVSNLMAGDNVLAVEVHQVNLTSSDITFGSEVSVLQNTAPSSLTISQSGGMVTLMWSGPAGSMLEAASAVTGPWSSSGVNQSQNQTFAPAGNMRFFRVREP